jgi:hypothetical protein
MSCRRFCFMSVVVVRQSGPIFSSSIEANWCSLASHSELKGLCQEIDWVFVDMQVVKKNFRDSANFIKIYKKTVLVVLEKYAYCFFYLAVTINL